MSEVKTVEWTLAKDRLPDQECDVRGIDSYPFLVSRKGKMFFAVYEIGFGFYDLADQSPMGRVLRSRVDYWIDVHDLLPDVPKDGKSGELWVSVKDRLPDKGWESVGLMVARGSFVHDSMYDVGRGFFGVAHRTTVFLHNVEYWINFLPLLPELPKIEIADDLPDRY
jgi:hypothetical protein